VHPEPTVAAGSTIASAGMERTSPQARIRFLLTSSGRFLKDPYVATCAVMIAIWLGAWLIAFPNVYGWLTDDIYQFWRVTQYEQGGTSLYDIQWFHAFDWLIVLLPWAFDWNVPSHMLPQAWNRAGEFRALILYVIVLHAIILALIAGFLRQLCSSKIVCAGALLLFMTSPTFMFYADLIDSRYLGMLAGLPALMILVSQFRTIGQRSSAAGLLFGFFLSGFLIGVGQSIHYTLLYFAVPVALVYWAYAYAMRPSKSVITKLTVFVLGVLAWFVPVQFLSLLYHPFAQSMIGTLFGQVQSLHSAYDKPADLASWLHFYIEEMGVPMMIAVIAGAAILLRGKSRPPYIDRFHAHLMLWSTAIATAYLLFTPSVAFYRQMSYYQLFYMLFAVTAIDVALRRWPAMPAMRVVAAALLFLCVAFVPSILRMPEVFVAAQGLGKAINVAHAKTGEANVFFIQFYDYSLHPQAIVSRHDFMKLRPGDYIVTDFPTLYFAKYPDLFALFHDTKPVASFPTEWCTNENWVEERTYWAFRRYQDEPESCNAQVYSVRDILNAERGRPLDVASVRADSTLANQQNPWQVFAVRNPETPIDYTIPCCAQFPFMGDLWLSAEKKGPHWFEVTFRKPASIGTITVVPPNYFAPPDFASVARPQSTKILASETPTGPMRQIWSSDNLRDDAIYTATFPKTVISTLRLEIVQPEREPLDWTIALDQRLPASFSAGIEYLRFPGYSVNLPPAAGKQTP
jgi:hypothetical protein